MPNHAPAFQEFLQELIAQQQQEIRRRLTAAGINGNTVNAGHVVGNFSPALVSIPQTASQVLQASETLAAGALVDIAAAGVRLADAALHIPAVAFVTAEVTGGANGLVYSGGLITGLSGLTKGATQYLSSAGTLTETMPTADGAMLQIIGKAVSTSTVAFHPTPPIIL